MSATIFIAPVGRRRIAGAPDIVAPDRILARCRELMRGGVLRPQAHEICVGIITDAALARHFETMSKLYLAALDDEDTRVAILARLMPNGPWPAADDCERIVRAVITGRLPQ